MAKAVRYHKQGGPEVLQTEDVAVGDPAQGQVRVRHTAIGVNFIDTYQRSGLYPMPLPAVAGNEGAGLVEAVGAGVTDFRAGDRVCYTGLPGSYCETRLVPAERTVKLPQGISEDQAASMLLKGLTVHYLIFSTYPVKKGETVLWHAAAGGVGLILCQWAKHLGAEVIGTTGSDAKAALARARGCDHVIVYAREDFAARVRELTGGAGVDVVYDSVGAPTFEGSLASLRPRGLMVSYGTAAGPIPPFDIFRLNRLGSLFLTSPSIFTYTRTREELAARAAGFFAAVAAGAVRIEAGHRFPLAEAACAHAALESRATTGAVALAP